jgi:hypothetical protein
VVPPCPRQTLPTYSFGSLQVKQAATQSFSFAWNSCYSATGITFRGDATAFTRELTGCPPASGAGNTCQIKVTFNPASSGEHQATLVVPDNTGADAVTIDLTGTATAESTDCFPYASKQDFGEVPVGTTQQMNFTYPWRSCDAIDQMQVVGGSGQFIATLTGCPPLARTDQCSFNVTFTPSDAGPQSANIVIPSDTGGQAVQIALTGTGTKVEVTTSPPQSGTTKPAPGVSDPVSPDPKPSATAPSTSKPDPQPDPQPSTSKPDPQLSTLPNSSLEAAPQPKAFPTTP